MIFEDKDIRKKFICHIWIHVAQGFDRKEKFIDILYQITKRTEAISMMTEDVLARKIYEHLEDKKYLVVLDNLRKKEDWDSFKVAFPENSEGSIVMVTTPYGNAVDSYWKSHNLGKLSNEEGWVLLKNNVFGTKGCNDQLLEGQRLDENTSSIRRLCFHSFTENTSSTHPLYSHSLTANKCAVLNSKHIHSLLLSSLQKSETTSFAQEQLTTIPSAFPLLRVLNIESIMLIDLQPNELYNLHLLRYVAIRSNLNLLPKSFKNLRKLEVLVIKTTARTLQIDGGIWNMEKLRHVHTNTSAQLPFPPKTHSVRICIRTLSTISPTSCTKEIFSKTPNLQKLGVRGNLAELLEEKHGICLFNNLEMLKNLENLKLYAQYDKVLRLPMGVMHTSKLKKITLFGTLFEWKDMFILGMLEDLEVLKLDEYAFKGEHWVLSKHYVFKRLQYLRIGRTNLVTWDATEDSFPTLRSLVLRNCNFLERIPDAFANIHTLEVMELFHMSENAVESAKEVTEKLKNSGFQLVITSQKISNNNSSRREDLQTAAMRVEIKQAVSERVDRLVHSVACNVEWSRGLASEIKDLTSDIETFNARVVEASINPFASLNSLRTKVNMIRQEHDNDLQPLTINPNYVLLSIQKIETPTVFDKVISEGVEQAVNTLNQTVKDNIVNPVCDIESEINNMTSHIKAFTDNLLKACKNPMANKHRVLRVILKRFRLLVNEANDAVGNYFAMETKHGQNSLPKSFHKIPFREKVNIYTSEIQSISAKVNTIRRDHGKDLIYLQDYKHIHLPPPQTQVAIQHENNIIGFDDDLEAIKVRLEASNDFVIPIVGTAGIGKTTFALEIFEDPEIRNIFTHCIWVHVSQGFHRKQNFIHILHQISKPTEDFSMISEDQLEAKIKETLEDQKYFIVLDDVRQEKDWNSLKAAFPENLNGSKVLVTTRYSNVIDSTRKSHILGGLSNDDENNSPRLYLSCYNKRRSPLPSGDEHVHSLLLSTSQKSEIHLTPKQLATIPNTFPLLKVLNIESLKFSSLPNELYGLFLLRYLAITGDIDSLPKSFKNLRELETLVIKTTKGMLHINGGIWNMRNLRHVHTNTSTQLPPLPKTAKNSFGGTNIHTLSTISPQSCTNEIFEKIPNLQILGVRGDLSDLLEEKQYVCMFNNLQMLCLDNLKLHGNSEKVLKVPMLNKFASKLRKLTLSGTLFQWNDMTVLGSLEELEVLKLDDNAFYGQRWDLSSDVIFKQLQYLRMGMMNLLTWTAVEESFPVLESLVLRNCIFLENIPFSFANVLSLKVMDLFHVSESAADSARKIGEQRHGKTTVKINGFNLFSSLIFCKKDS
nr:putative late blight resistance protein homolog R1B-8 [Ipomoea batatas]